MTTLRDYAYPKIGQKRVDWITSADIMAVLLPIWNTKPPTAQRVRQRIGTVMKWAIAQGYRMDNPAGAALGAALPKQGGIQRHHRALPYGEVAGAIQTVRQSKTTVAVKLAFEFLVLTACRSGEVREARWEEIDLEVGEWRIPPQRMKHKREHRVPLSGRAREILTEARENTVNSKCVFPSAAGRLLSDLDLSGLLRELEIAAVPHGFRSSFPRLGGLNARTRPMRSWRRRCRHLVQNKVEAAYARSDLFERRRALMEQWAEFLGYEWGNRPLTVRRLPDWLDRLPARDVWDGSDPPSGCPRECKLRHPAVPDLGTKKGGSLPSTSEIPDRPPGGWRYGRNLQEG